MAAITAHRGFWRNHPENSLEAFRAAIELGVDWIELDVQLTQDDHLVVFHDRDLKRLGRSEIVSELDWAELRNLDIGGLHGDARGTARIPLFREVLDLVAGRVRLNVELKSCGSSTRRRRLVDATWAAIVDAGAKAICVITSFDREVVVLALERGAQAGAAIDDLDYWPTIGQLISIQHELIDKSVVARAHESGWPIHAWTVNDTRRARRLFELGVANVITDRPDLLLQETS